MHSTKSKNYKWVPAYLAALREGMTIKQAAIVVGTGRRVAIHARRKLMGFAREEQLARDEGEVVREIAKQEDCDA